MSTLVVHGPARIDGRAVVPGDKSISHRALMLASLADGSSTVTNLAPGDDVAATGRCLEAVGAAITPGTDGVSVDGVSHWSAPAAPLDCANSGTTMRLLAGLAAHHAFETVLDGDRSLRARPMDRVARPLRALGAAVGARRDRFPPLSVRGGRLRGVRVETEVPSAQVKSCALLAGLAAEGETVVSESVRTRDHTERMLAWLGAPVDVGVGRDGSVTVGVRAFRPKPFALDVPGDPSSAAFLVAAAFLCGRVEIDGVGLNETRTGFYETCARMGGDVDLQTLDERGGEPVGRIRAERSDLRGLRVEGSIVPSMIDEIPLVAVLSTAAHGATLVTGAGELRVKESDRIATTCAGLRRLGADIAERSDGFEVHGPSVLRGATVAACGDHRIAMALAVAALSADGETRIEGFEAAAVSWPGFERALTELGAEVELQ
jgi:3-phosphoshikimate 1-carboxyvinyltransferase